MPKHVHAELIKAWADGAEIEHRYSSLVAWDPTPTPTWDTLLEYRIKPPPQSLGQIAYEAANPGYSWEDATGYGKQRYEIVAQAVKQAVVQEILNSKT